MSLSNDETHIDLFINENLTLLNYLHFIKLKSEKRRRNENYLANFEVVYTFQGKFFVKNERTVGNQGASHIPTNSTLQTFLDHLDRSHTTSLQKNCSPFPREEFAALLPSTAQRGGHNAPPHPDAEAITATTAQHRGPTATPQPEQDIPTAPSNYNARVFKCLIYQL